ncbi:MAG TPA: DUF1801 domain-containing protein [Polyangium sp.]|nr:DUF1801 domain-containing protein [Polyangium sp.]
MAAKTVQEYLDNLPEDRREALEAIRKVILANLDKDYEEGIQYGMIGYYVPHRVFPPGYHCDPKQPLPFASIASQKNHLALYLMCVYGSTELDTWFRDAWAKTGKKLDMGKGCVRFKKLSDVPLNVVGETIKRVPAKKYIETYQATLGATKSAKKAAKKEDGNDAPAKAPAEKAPAKKTAAPAKKAATKKATK